MAQLCAHLSKAHPPEWFMKPVVTPGADLTVMLEAGWGGRGRGWGWGWRLGQG